jgi:hypothetical protein
MTRLIVGTVALYLVAVAALVGLWSDPSQLLEPVPWYRLTVFWTLPEASATRLAALIAAGREAEGLLYAVVVGLSFGLLGALAMFGASLALMFKADQRRLRLFEAFLFICLLAGLVMTADPVDALVRKLEMHGMMGATPFNAMPGCWIITTALTCALFARYAALLAHDAAAWSRGVWLCLLAPILREWRARMPARAILVDPPIGFTPPPSWAAPRWNNPRSAPR